MTGLGDLVCSEPTGISWLTSGVRCDEPKSSFFPPSLLLCGVAVEMSLKAHRSDFQNIL